MHLIILAKQGPLKYAYYFSTDSKQNIMDKYNELIAKTSSKELVLCSCHVMLGPETDFKSIQAMDPYFHQAIPYHNLDDFLALVSKMVV